MSLGENIPVDLRDPIAVIELFERAAEALRASPVRQHCVVRLPAQPGSRLLATGDLHDNPIHLRKIIRLATLEQSPDHHVVLHEIIHGEHLVNGMDFSHRMLARVAELALRYPAQVHPVLANHELSQMTGKGVSKGAGNSVELFNDGLDFVFGDEAGEVSDAIKIFIAAMPIALLTESGVCCAHSLPAPHMMSKFDLDLFERDLTEDDYRSPAGAAYLMVWGRDHDAAQLESLASHWGVKFFCLGHEHVETGIEMKGPRLIVLNSDHERAAVLPLELTHISSAEEAFMAAIPLAAVNMPD